MSTSLSVKVVACFRGGAYVARAGRGKAATSASSTDRPQIAARRAAAKYFRIDACNVQTEDDIQLAAIPVVNGYAWTASLPQQNGGAS